MNDIARPEVSWIQRKLFNFPVMTVLSSVKKCIIIIKKLHHHVLFVLFRKL